MNNGPLHDDPLLRAVQERLGDYEAPYNGADWDAMNRSLDQLPRTNRFRFRFSLNTMLALAGVAGAVALASYFILRTDSAKVPSGIVAKPNVQPVAKPAEPVQQPVLAVAVSQTQSETTAAMIPAKFSKKLFRISPADTGNLRFGDQIDPLKGFVRSTQEHIDSLVIPVTKPVPLDSFIKKEIISNGSDSNSPQETPNSSVPDEAKSQADPN
jgi:hypothetical protein